MLVNDSGIASTVARRQSVPFDNEKFAKNRGKKGKIRKNGEKEEKNREEKSKIGKVLSLCPF